jgi:diguanylate cyclase (GGDEF)-like protein
MIVKDASRDLRFRDNPLVCGEANIRFYAGYPLSAPDGSRVGTLCVMDTAAREISLEQAQLLRDLGRMVEEELVDADHATTDPVTSLSNRNGFVMIADHLLSTSTRAHKPTTMLTFHFVNLRNIEKEFGKNASEVAAIELAHELMSGFRHSDVIARIAPDLFCVLLADTGLDDVIHARRRFGEDINHRNRDVDNHRKLLLDVDAIAFDPKQHSNAKGLIKAATDVSSDKQRVTAA